MHGEDELLAKACLEAGREGKLPEGLRRLLAQRFGRRFENAWKAVVEGAVKKYVFQPSGRIVWIVVGKERDYQLLPEVGYCTCDDYYYRVLDGEALLCYHLIAQRLAESLNRYELVEAEDYLYERLMEEWRHLKKEWFEEEASIEKGKG
ncbi:MAG: hypothetical protein DRO52_03025 [Candidatus Hecatellales archaeon]|nr:MAG: hypothetical protein DRO52_03025 [Candidatus Hecatellales archaeon]